MFYLKASYLIGFPHKETRDNAKSMLHFSFYYKTRSFTPLKNMAIAPINDFQICNIEAPRRAAKRGAEGHRSRVFAPLKGHKVRHKNRERPRISDTPKRVALASVTRVTVMNTDDTTKHDSTTEKRNQPTHHSRRDLRSMNRITEAGKYGGQLTGADL